MFYQSENQFYILEYFTSSNGVNCPFKEVSIADAEDNAEYTGDQLEILLLESSI